MHGLEAEQCQRLAWKPYASVDNGMHQGRVLKLQRTNCRLPPSSLSGSPHDQQCSLLSSALRSTSSRKIFLAYVVLVHILLFVKASSYNESFVQLTMAQ